MMNSLFELFVKRDSAADLQGLKTILKMYQKDQLTVDDELLTMLITITKYHYADRKIILLACHIMSNIALEEDHAVSMVEQGAAKILCKVLKKNSDDSRIVWKATSALWNLCRPHNIGDYIPETCPALVFSCLVRNSNSSRATHTCLGALSNLALVCPESFKRCMTRPALRKLRSIIKRYKHANEICGHFGALVANMSVCAELAQDCVALDYIHLLVHCLRNGNIHAVEATKHIVAALHNLSDIDEFASRLCVSTGVEVLRTVQEHHEGEIHEFVEGIFELGGLPVSSQTSLHVASVCCDIPVIAQVLQTADIECVDADGKTALDLAVENACAEVVELLLGSGARLNESVFEDLEDSERRSIAKYVKRGKNLRVTSQNHLNQVVTGSSKMVCDCGSVVLDYLPGIDILLSSQKCN
jgi:hypothetical protein